MDNLDIDERNTMNSRDTDGGWNSRFTSWEQECLHSMENSEDVDHQVERDKDVTSQKVWHCFQNAACCVAQMYKEGGISLWIPFQNAASSVTTLYKECTESHKRFAELGYLSGVHRRNKEILAWVKKRKRCIRREDLITMLTGNHHHPHFPHYLHRNTWSVSRQRHSMQSDQSGSNSMTGSVRTPPHNVAFTRLSLSDNAEASDVDGGDGDLQTFREALSLSGIRNSPTHGTSSTNRRMLSSRSSSTYQDNSGASLAELNAFITEEFTRHVARKRSSSSSDVIMDSPTHKRSKFL